MGKKMGRNECKGCLWRRNNHYCEAYKNMDDVLIDEETGLCLGFTQDIERARDIIVDNSYGKKSPDYVTRVLTRRLNYGKA